MTQNIDEDVFESDWAKLVIGTRPDVLSFHTLKSTLRNITSPKISYCVMVILMEIEFQMRLKIKQELIGEIQILMVEG